MLAGWINQTTQKLSRPMHSFSEYQLVARPDIAIDNHLLDEIRLLQQENRDIEIGNEKPAIVIAGFFGREAMEETMIRWIQRICSNQLSFEVTLNNYSGVPPDTIYARIVDPLPFLQLAKQFSDLHDFIRSSSVPPAQVTTKPYLSVVRKLNEVVFMKAMMEFSQKTFHGIFLMKELLLLRKENESREEKIVNVFRFLPKD